MTAPPLLEFRGVSKTFRARGRRVTALRGVSLAVAPGETLAIAGESGGGKTTLGRIALGILAPDEGRILWNGTERAPARLARAQGIFQDPGTSLNPRWRAGEIVTEALALARDPAVRGAAARARRAAELLAAVGIDPGRAREYPHQFSGGERQRLAIARAIAPRPPLIVADEPLAALDVLTAAEILALLRRLKQELGLALLMISHDLAWVARIADRIAVMRQGEIVECGPAARVLTQPQHPYTQSLLSSFTALKTAAGA